MYKLHFKRICYVLVFLSFMTNNVLLAQTSDSDSLTIVPDTLPSIFQKLVAEQLIHFKIEADFDLLYAEKNSTEERKAYLTLTGKDTTAIKMPIKIRPRGVYRRRFCEVPPLRINFDDEALEKLGLNTKFDKLKLVTHCVNDKNSEQVLLREYWTYMLHNQLTPNSFKVHLIKVTYINARTKVAEAEKLAFVIENNEEMAHRLGGSLVEVYGTTPSKVGNNTLEHTMMFNYMIGNLDWNIQRQRNIKLVKLPAQEKLLIVPYDFDMSAIVWPSYARLNPDFKQQRFSDRYCVGRFETEADLVQTVERFKNLESDYYKSFQACPYLNKRSKKKMKVFLQSFFKPLKDKKGLRKAFL